MPLSELLRSGFWKKKTGRGNCTPSLCPHSFVRLRRFAAIQQNVCCRFGFHFHQQLPRLHQLLCSIQASGILVHKEHLSVVRCESKVSSLRWELAMRQWHSSPNGACLNWQKNDFDWGILGPFGLFVNPVDKLRFFRHVKDISFEWILVISNRLLPG